MGPRPSKAHSIERKRNDGNYDPDNCRWATRSEQARNKRSTVFIEYRGLRKLAIEWAEELGIPYQLVYRRYRRGLPIGEHST